jgi:hypothetical protein
LEPHAHTCTPAAASRARRSIGLAARPATGYDFVTEANNDGKVVFYFDLDASGNCACARCPACGHAARARPDVWAKAKNEETKEKGWNFHA